MKTLLAAGALATLLGSVAMAQTDDTPAPVPDAGMMDFGMGMGPGMGGPMGGGMAGMMGALFGTDFATLDANGDGQITEDDLSARAAARFAQADTDGSGGLTGAEIVAMAEVIRQEMMAARLQDRLSRIDDSGDGELQLDEMTARAPAPIHFFDRFDTDNDGAVSPAEYEAAQAEMAAMRAQMQTEGRPREGWGFWNRDGHGPRHGG